MSFFHPFLDLNCSRPKTVTLILLNSILIPPVSTNVTSLILLNRSISLFTLVLYPLSINFILVLTFNIQKYLSVLTLVFSFLEPFCLPSPVFHRMSFVKYSPNINHKYFLKILFWHPNYSTPSSSDYPSSLSGSYNLFKRYIYNFRCSWFYL